MPTVYHDHGSVRVGLTTPGQYTDAKGVRREHTKRSIIVAVGSNWLRLTGTDAARLYHALGDPKISAFVNELMEDEKNDIPERI